MKYTLHILLLISISLTAGCMSTGKLKIDNEFPTMKEIYDNHQTKIDAPRGGLPNMVDFRDESTLREGITDELDESFPILRNPFIAMYIFPHLSRDGEVVIPGYWVSFPLYERFEFALPGEQVDLRDRY